MNKNDLGSCIIGLVVVLILLCLARGGHCIDYYVDYSSGNDNSNGLTESTAWKTLAMINSQSFTGPDNIKFNKGDTWREQLTVPSSGTSGNPITFTSYGTGDKPLLIGSYDFDDSGTWEAEGTSNLWVTKSTLPIDVGMLWHDMGLIADDSMVWATKNQDTSTLATNWAFSYISTPGWDDSSKIVVYMDPDMNPADACTGLEIPVIEKGIYAVGKSNVDISDMHLMYASGVALSVENTTNININNMTVDYSGGMYSSGVTRYGNGIAVLSGASNVSVTNCEVSQIYEAGVTNQSDSAVTQDDITFGNNTITYCGSGMESYTAVDGAVFTNIVYSNNTFDYSGAGWSGLVNGSGARITGYGNSTFNIALRDNRWSNSAYRGVRFQRNGVITFERNIITDSADFGLVFLDYPSAAGATPTATVSYCLISGSVSSGMAIDNNGDIDVSNCVFYDNGTGTKYNVHTGDACDNWTMRNCIIYTTSSNYRGWLDGNASQYGDGDYNIHWHEDATGKIIAKNNGGYVSYNRSELATYQAASSQEANSIAADPLFKDAANGNFHTISSSPCRNAGINVGLTRDFDGHRVGLRPEIGAYELQNKNKFLRLMGIY